MQDLHEGEAESIALAIELNAGIIILDETEARRIAEQHGLLVIGIIGILLKAKADKKIRSMRAELERLQKTGGTSGSANPCIKRFLQPLVKAKNNFFGDPP